MAQEPREVVRLVGTDGLLIGGARGQDGVGLRGHAGRRAREQREQQENDEGGHRSPTVRAHGGVQPAPLGGPQRALPRGRSPRIFFPCSCPTPPPPPSPPSWPPWPGGPRRPSARSAGGWGPTPS